MHDIFFSQYSVVVIYFLPWKTSCTPFLPTTYNSTSLISDGDKKGWIFPLSPAQWRPNKRWEQKEKQHTIENQAIEIKNLLKCKDLNLSVVFVCFFF